MWPPQVPNRQQRDRTDAGAQAERERPERITTIADMSPSEIVTAFIEAIERKDVAAAAAMASPSISYENMPMQPIVGREAMAAEPAPWRCSSAAPTRSTG